jgi:hypothetical protein
MPIENLSSAVSRIKLEEEKFTYGTSRHTELTVVIDWIARCILTVWHHSDSRKIELLKDPNFLQRQDLHLIFPRILHAVQFLWVMAILDKRAGF